MGAAAERDLDHVLAVEPLVAGHGLEAVEHAFQGEHVADHPRKQRVIPLQHRQAPHEVLDPLGPPQDAPPCRRDPC